MEVHNYLSLIKRWLWLIVLGGFVAAVAAFVFSKSQKPVYEATSVLLISEGMSSASSGSDFQSFQLSERLAQSYIERLTNYEVLTQSITNLGLGMDGDDLRKSVQVGLINNSQLIRLSVQDTSPQVAASLANEIPQVFAERNMSLQLERFANSKENLETELTQIKDEIIVAEATLLAEQNNGNKQITLEQLTENVLRLRETHSRLLQSYEDIRIAEASSLNNLTIDESARVPSNPISPRITTNTLLAGAVGIMLAVAIVFLIEYLDNTIKDPEILEQMTGISTIGLIPRYISQNGDEQLVMATDPRSPNAEAYRQVRTNVQYVGVSRKVETICVTSANAGEGKSSTAANLALALAQANSKVVLIDTDMRHPSLHHKFNVANSMGLTDLLLNKENQTDFIQDTKIPNLRLITSGSLPPNPAELIHSERMNDIIDWIHQDADYIILDSPPVLAVTDALLLAQIASTTLFVVESGKTNQQSLLLAIKQLESVDAHIAGIILNKLDPRRNGYYYNTYYRSNYHYHEDGNSGRNATENKTGLRGVWASILSMRTV